LKVITFCSRGISHVPVDYLNEKYGCIIKNYDDSELYVANDVADCGMFHVLESFRKFSYQQSKLREVLDSIATRGYLRGDDENELSFCFGHELKIVNKDVLEYMYTNSPMHKKALILGFGKIGQTLAKKLKYGLSMNVSYSTRSGKNTTDKDVAEFEYYPWGQWNEKLSQFDCIILCLPLSPQTKHIIDEQFLLNCSRFEKGNLNHLCLVNLGRGLLIDWSGIPKNFIKSRIRHVGLDVFYAEPKLTRECADLTLANSSVTPHIGSSTFEVYNRSSEFCLDLIKKTLDE
ncbi:NAD(P)-binding protein, partial [Hanseniaspora valbyensis NRRL Y-1626]